MADEDSAREWVAEAAEGLPDAEAFRRACTALVAIEKEPRDLALTIGVRAIVAAHMSRCFKRPIAGPEWRLDPTETDRLTRNEWAAQMKIFL